MAIHTGHPFATPDDQRSPVRRLRGRFPGTVTLWTSYLEQARSGSVERRPVGLTMSSTVVVDGDPGRLLGVLDEESDLFAAIRDSGRFVVTLLHGSERRIADQFGGILPTPGGPFHSGEWLQTPYGLVPATPAEPANTPPPATPAEPANTPPPGSDRTWAACVVDELRPLGFGQLVLATIEKINLARGEVPLVYYRGRYADGGRHAGQVTG